MKVLYYSTVNWNWIKQRPHFISYYLSKNNFEVDYFSMTPFFKQKITKNNTDSKNLNIKDIYVIPFSNKIKIIEIINKTCVEKLLSKNKYDIIILTHPFQLKFVKNSLKSNRKIIYECMDNMPYFYNNQLRDRVKQYEKELCLLADNIITSSNYLEKRLINDYNIDNKKVSVIKNAVDCSFLYNKCLKPIGLKHPNLMYIGTISDWFDFDTINKFAYENPSISIYLVGPIENRVKTRISKLDNIILIGPVRHELVKRYILDSDIMIIPFIVNDIIKGVDPVKIYEYLSLNKIVISSYWEEIKCFSSNVFYYHDYQSFIHNYLELNNLQKNNSINSLNVDFINKNNWNKRINEYIRVIES